MKKFLRIALPVSIVLTVLYVINPLDFCPGPVDDVIVSLAEVLFYIVGNKLKLKAGNLPEANDEAKGEY